jgi:hypothetical protein
MGPAIVDSQQMRERAVVHFGHRPSISRRKRYMRLFRDGKRNALKLCKLARAGRWPCRAWRYLQAFGCRQAPSAFNNPTDWLEPRYVRNDEKSKRRSTCGAERRLQWRAWSQPKCAATGMRRLLRETSDAGVASWIQIRLIPLPARQ